jgi:AbiV family abortive infection protein
MGESSMNVTSDVLLRGALHALRHCGLLLEDASLLLEHGRHSTAAGIALLAREQLGWHRMLLDHWRRSVAGTTVTVADLAKGADDHAAKQSQGQRSLTYDGQRGDGLDRPLAAREAAPPGSDERGRLFVHAVGQPNRVGASWAAPMITVWSTSLGIRVSRRCGVLTVDGSPYLRLNYSGRSAGSEIETALRPKINGAIGVIR